MKYDVFISYSRKDFVDEKQQEIPNNIVSKIRTTLTEAGISYWLDEENIYSGENFTQKIVTNIEDSKVFLFLSTVNSNKSRWTCKEIACADEFGKHIIPVRIDSSPYNKQVLFRIADLDYIEYFTNHEKGLKRMIDSIKNYLAELEGSQKQEQEQEDVHSNISLAEPSIIFYNDKTQNIIVFFDGFEYTGHIDTSKISQEYIADLKFDKEKSSFPVFIKKHNDELNLAGSAIMCISPKHIGYLDACQLMKNIPFVKRLRLCSYLEITGFGEFCQCPNEDDDAVKHFQFQNEQLWYCGGNGVCEIVSSDCGINCEKGILSDDNFIKLFFIGCVNYVCVLKGFFDDILLLQKNLCKVSVGLVDKKFGVNIKKDKVENLTCLIETETHIPYKKCKEFKLENKYDLLIDIDNQWAIVPKWYIVDNLKCDDFDIVWVSIDIDANNRVTIEISDRCFNSRYNCFEIDFSELEFKKYKE